MHPVVTRRGLADQSSQLRFDKARWRVAGVLRGLALGRPCRFLGRFFDGLPGLRGLRAFAGFDHFGLPLFIALGDGGHAPTGSGACAVTLQRAVAVLIGVLIVRLYQEPIVALVGPAAHADQMPFALQALAVEDESEPSPLVAGPGIADGLPGALVPQHDGAAAILPFGDSALEASIF